MVWIDTGGLVIIFGMDANDDDDDDFDRLQGVLVLLNVIISCAFLFRDGRSDLEALLWKETPLFRTGVVMGCSMEGLCCCWW